MTSETPKTTKHIGSSHRQPVLASVGTGRTSKVIAMSNHNTASP